MSVCHCVEAKKKKNSKMEKNTAIHSPPHCPPTSHPLTHFQRRVTKQRGQTQNIAREKIKQQQQPKKNLTYPMLTFLHHVLTTISFVDPRLPRRRETVVASVRGRRCTRLWCVDGCVQTRPAFFFIHLLLVLLPHALRTHTHSPPPPPLPSPHSLYRLPPPPCRPSIALPCVVPGR